MPQKRLNKNDFHHLGQYKVPLLYFYICLPTVRHSLKKYPRLIPWYGGLYLDGHIFLDKKTWESIKQETINSIQDKENSFFNDFYKLSKQTVDKVALLSRQLLKEKSPSIQQIKEFLLAFNDMEYPWYYSLPIGEGLESILNNLTQTGKIKPEVAQSFYKLEKLTPLMKQQRELTAIKKNITPSLLKKISNISADSALKIIKENDTVLYKKIKRHVNRYRWFGMMHFWGEPFSEEKCINQLLLIETSNKRVEKIKLTKEQQYFKKHAALVSYWRQTFADTCAIASFSVLKVLGSQGYKKSGLDYEQLMWLTPPEFISLLQGKFKPNKTILNQRKKRYGLIQRDGKREVVIGKRLDSLLKQFIQKPPKTTEFKGSIACKGLVRGRVKVVLIPAEINKVKKGDIIVSHETTPDFMPAISKANAIVTDIGGISSHAAIISRELNIPCIVGTKIATQILKDNDIIEVDANNGIIKKII